MDKKYSGITLIELIMTMVVIGVVVIPSAVFLAESIRGVFRAEDTVAATNIARMEMERLYNLSYDSVALAVGTDTTLNYQNTLYDLRCIKTQTTTNGESIKQVIIEVYPAGLAGNANYLLTKLISYRTENVLY